MMHSIQEKNILFCPITLLSSTQVFFFHIVTVGLLTFLEVLLVKEEQMLDQVEC